MEKQKITGYRELSDAEVTAMNKAKELGNGIGAFIGELEQYPEIDKRWLAIAKTDLQKGIMFLARAIARPTSF